MFCIYFLVTRRNAFAQIWPGRPARHENYRDGEWWYVSVLFRMSSMKWKEVKKIKTTWLNGCKDDFSMKMGSRRWTATLTVVEIPRFFADTHNDRGESEWKQFLCCVVRGGGGNNDWWKEKDRRKKKWKNGGSIHNGHVKVQCLVVVRPSLTLAIDLVWIFSLILFPRLPRPVRPSAGQSADYEREVGFWGWPPWHHIRVHDREKNTRGREGDKGR